MRGFTVFVLFVLLIITSIFTLINKVAREREEVAQKRRNDQLRVEANLFSAVLNGIVGDFKQINTYGDPIYKHASGGTWGMQQISTTGQAIYKQSLFGNAISGLGKVAWWGAAGIEAVNVAEAAGKDLKEGKITNTVHAGSKALGSWTGAAYGASAGAAMLSFIPVVGTLAGGIGGGALGAFAGTFAGEVAADVVVGPTRN